jgi:predicted nucleotidyltransferase
MISLKLLLSEQLDFSGFKMNKTLNPKIWTDDMSMHPDIRKTLLQIANDYLDYLEVEVELDDVILTGSLANYNWSKYSDFDVHLVFKFSDIDENVELVQKFLDAAEKVWKFQHDLTIDGFPVELYCQDSDAEHTSTGIYSILNDEWVKKPIKEDFTPDEELIKTKARKVMDSIKELEDDLEKDVDSKELLSKLKKTWKKIKDARQAGLEKEGEYSIENLIFKLLRRNGYIQRILDVKKKAYDKQFK